MARVEIKFDRPHMTNEELDAGLKLINDHFQNVLKRKGKGICVSSHEILGIVGEEYDELVEAVRSNKCDDIELELKDVAIAAIYGLISISRMK